MRHGKADKRLGRNDDHRRAMLRNLTTSLFTHGTIETTIVRAKEVSRTAARMITRAKKGDLHSRRLVASYLTSEDVVKKLFDVIAQLGLTAGRLYAHRTHAHPQGGRSADGTGRVAAKLRR